MIRDRLRAGALRELPAGLIVAAIAKAAQRWSDSDFAPRVRATQAIAARTGYCAAAVEFALDQLFTPGTADALTAAIEAEVGSLAALDGFVARAGRPDVFARGVERVCVISSRTTIGVALPPALYALCAKCDITVKDREDDLIVAFFRTLSEEHEAFAQAARAQTFSSDEDTAFDLSEFECVVAFGTNATLARLRGACDPNARFVGFGTRASAGYISASAARDNRRLPSILAGAARDLILYDSEGCMSLHVLFVEGAEGAELVAEQLALALERATLDFPLGWRDSSSASRVAAASNAAAFRAALGQGRLFTDDARSFAIVFDPPRDQPPPLAPRCIGVVPVEGPSDAAAYVGANGVALEAIALSDDRADILGMAVEAGAARLTRFGELQRPALGGNHGGRPRLADFIRWIDKET